LSSILDALNKLEKEKSRQDHPLKRLRAGGSIFTSKAAMGVIGFVCICIGVIGFATFYRKGPEKSLEPLRETLGSAETSRSQESSPPKTSILEQKKPLASLKEKPAPVPSTSSDPNKMATSTTNQPQTRSLDKKAETKPVALNAGNNKAKMETESLRSVEAEEDSMAESVTDTGGQGPQPQVVSSEKDTPVISKGTVVQEKKPLPMNRLESGGFKIQAISWGETPQERLVVINNQVLREGGSIEGYQISHINPDDIVLRRSGKAYRLDFGLKGQP